MIAGIDVGKKNHVAVIKGRKIVYVGTLEDCDVEFEFAGIDAPLSFPKEGYFRECERKLHRMGIRLLPPKFIERIALKGIEIAERLKRRGVVVYEVYPYATRVLLNIAPKVDKKKAEGRLAILSDLRRFIDVEDFEDHNIVDAIISALTVRLHIEGEGEIVEGRDGAILIPKPQFRFRYGEFP